MCAVLYVDKKPTEVHLRRHVIAHVGKSWMALLSYLGVPANVIDREVIDNRGNVKEAFFRSLLWWRRGNSENHPSTWEELLVALKYAEFKDLADELRQRLLNNDPAVSPILVRHK